MGQTPGKVKRKIKKRRARGVNRSKFIGVTTTPRNYRAWVAAARADELTLSTWVNRRCNGQPTTAPAVDTVPGSKPPTEGDS